MPSSGKHLFHCLYSSWRRKKETNENSPAWKRLNQRFTLRELRTITNNFNIARRVDDFSSDDFSFSVYRGYINDSYKDLVAIKVFKQKASDHQRFLTEMELLSNLRHANIVSLIGYCCDGSDNIIVHEYTPHGTLEDHLLNTNNVNPPLSWKQRLQICIGVARGLEFLHAANPSIVHRDIKCKNILVNKYLVAKLSNFDLSKLISTSLSESDNHVTTALVGTWGYVDPEYMWAGRLTVKSDVYSFGVVLFEVLCAKTVLELVQREQISLAEHGRRCVEDGLVDQIIDPCLKGEIAPKSLKAYTNIAYNCLNERGNERPTMADVAKKLELTLLLQECTEADIPFSPSWLRSIPWPVEGRESPTESQDEEFSHYEQWRIYNEAFDGTN
ncbi:Malectin/receptor protein kinase family protein [Theobroma cacao]|uniref:Malectin/receptor protein kinase family protein n=1 Tax=Theobroma cacao TaxID=3641 RepID=A0A061FDN0_THECC|nr:Malectin/receptor protein kinase family protein [Theobroma cacao]